MALLTLGAFSLMLFLPSFTVPQLLIRSLTFHILSTGRFISSNLLPPVPKFWWFLLTIIPFLRSMTDLIILFPLFIAFQDMK